MVLWLFNIWLKTYNTRYFPKVNWLRYIVSFAFAFCLIYVVTSIRPPHIAEIGKLRFFPFIGSAANNTIILILMNLISTREKKAELELEKANLEAANLSARFETLTHQIQPHFLFNALNTLKLLIGNDAKRANDYVLRLSNLLRASIYERKQDEVSLKSELEVLKDYLELQKVRFPNSIVYNEVLIDSDPMSYSLPSFSLQILAENAIKHNAFSEDKPLHIEIFTNGEALKFTNNMIPKSEIESPGIGLTNLSERMKILTGVGLVVLRDLDEKIFSVEMKMQQL